MTWEFKLEPTLEQISEIERTLSVCRKVLLSLEADVDIPDVPFHGHSIGIDVGLEYFLSTSDGVQVKRPRFFDSLHRKLKLLQRRLKTKTKSTGPEAGTLWGDPRNLPLYLKGQWERMLITLETV